MGTVARHGVIWAATDVVALMLVLFQLTGAPSVTFVDSGELAAVSTVLGVAHPTGYPLFTLLGRVASMLPWGSEQIFRLNAFSSVLTALAVGLIVPLTLLLGKTKNRSHRAGQVVQKAIAIGCYFAASGVPVIFGGQSPVEAPKEVTKILTETWFERFKGSFHFEPDQQKMLDLALDYIDKARAALKLKKYESGKFGTEKVLMDMAARREIEKAAKPHVGL